MLLKECFCICSFASESLLAENAKNTVFKYRSLYSTSLLHSRTISLTTFIEISADSFILEYTVQWSNHRFCSLRGIPRRLKMPRCAISTDISRYSVKYFSSNVGLTCLINLPISGTSIPRRTMNLKTYQLCSFHRNSDSQKLPKVLIILTSLGVEFHVFSTVSTFFFL